MVIEPILKGLLLGLILSISIGPVIFAIIKQSLTNGKRSGYAFVAGVSSSDIILLFICKLNLKNYERNKTTVWMSAKLHAGLFWR